MNKGWVGIFDSLIESSGDCDHLSITKQQGLFPLAPSTWDENEKKEYDMFQEALFASFTDLNKIGVAFEIALDQKWG